MAEITLILPVHNDQHYIKRSIAFHNHQDIKLLIVDSSIKPYTSAVLDNIIYLHYPNKGFSEKILKALDKTNTEIVAVCAIDDFIVIDTLLSTVELFKGETDIVACVGKYKGFYEPFNNSFVPIYNYKNDWISRNSDSVSRVKKFMSTYSMILWAVYRKEVLKEAYCIIEKVMNSTKNDNFIEFILGVFLAYKGQIKKINSIWGYREISKRKSWGKIHKNILRSSKEELDHIQHLLSKDIPNQVVITGLNAYIKFDSKTLHNFQRIKRKIIRIFSLITSKLYLDDQTQKVKKIILSHKKLP